MELGVVAAAGVRVKRSGGIPRDTIVPCCQFSFHDPILALSLGEEVF